MTRETKVGLSLIGVLLLLLTMALYQRFSSDSARRLSEGRVDPSYIDDDGRPGRLHQPLAVEVSTADPPVATSRSTARAARSGWNRHQAEGAAYQRQASAEPSERDAAREREDSVPDASSPDGEADTRGTEPSASHRATRSLDPPPRFASDDSALETSAWNDDDDPVAAGHDAPAGELAEAASDDDSRASGHELRHARAAQAGGYRTRDKLSHVEASPESLDSDSDGTPLLERADDVQLEPARERDADSEPRSDAENQSVEDIIAGSSIAARSSSTRRLRSAMAEDAQPTDTGDETSASVDTADDAAEPISPTNRARRAVGELDRAEVRWRHDRTAADSGPVLRAGARSGKQSSRSSEITEGAILSQPRSIVVEQAGDDDEQQNDASAGRRAADTSARPERSVPVKRTEHRAPVTEDSHYQIQEGDSFASIAAREYRDARYAKALAEFNRTAGIDIDQLSAGDSLTIPTVEELRQRFPDKCPVQRNPEVPSDRRAVPAQGQRAERMYVVAEGDTLFDIARQELGKASRWAEIYRLNEAVLDEEFDQLQPGTKLRLPVDAD